MYTSPISTSCTETTNKQTNGNRADVFIIEECYHVYCFGEHWYVPGPGIRIFLLVFVAVGSGTNWHV